MSDTLRSFPLREDGTFDVYPSVPSRQSSLISHRHLVDPRDQTQAICGIQVLGGWRRYSRQRDGIRVPCGGCEKVVKAAVPTHSLPEGEDLSAIDIARIALEWLSNVNIQDRARYLDAMPNNVPGVQVLSARLRQIVRGIELPLIPQPLVAFVDDPRREEVRIVGKVECTCPDPFTEDDTLCNACTDAEIDALIAQGPVLTDEQMAEYARSVGGGD